MQRTHSLITAVAAGILLALPASSAQAWWGWGPGSWWNGDGWGDFGFHFGFGFRGDGCGYNRWYRPWYGYGYPYHRGYPYYGYHPTLAYTVYQPAVTQATTEAEK